MLRFHAYALCKKQIKIWRETGSNVYAGIRLSSLVALREAAAILWPQSAVSDPPLDASQLVGGRATAARDPPIKIIHVTKRSRLLTFSIDGNVPAEQRLDDENAQQAHHLGAFAGRKY